MSPVGGQERSFPTRSPQKCRPDPGPDTPALGTHVDPLSPLPADTFRTHPGGRPELLGNDTGCSARRDPGGSSAYAPAIRGRRSSRPRTGEPTHVRSTRG
ncbi:hypothetical protein CURTO8I2_80198 [Curtobacterium sp. 8I-2]|nr:hypothetical protein CURTO8I2_80198 [Curtobacterium sp. 8I-2]